MWYGTDMETETVADAFRAVELDRLGDLYEQQGNLGEPF